MTPASKQLLGLLRKVPADMMSGQIPFSANLAISTVLSKAIMAMQGLERPKNDIHSALRQDQT